MPYALSNLCSFLMIPHFWFLQINFSLLFSLMIAFVSDGLSTVPDKASILSSDASFRREFNDIVSEWLILFCVLTVKKLSDYNFWFCWWPHMVKVMATGNDPIVEGFVGGIRLAWVVHLMLIQDGTASRESVLSGSSNEMGYLSQCLEVIFSENVFQFLLDKVLRTAAYQVHLLCHIAMFFIQNVLFFFELLVNKTRHAFLVGGRYILQCS